MYIYNMRAVYFHNHIFHNCAKNALKAMIVGAENIISKIFSEFTCSIKKRE